LKVFFGIRADDRCSPFDAQDEPVVYVREPDPMP
jgi:hypothetical protein